MNTTGYRYLAAPDDGHVEDALAQVDALGLQLQRREKTTGRAFMPLQRDQIENQWAALIDFTQGKHKAMSAEAAHAAQVELARVFKFRARVYTERKPEGRNVRIVRRVALEDLGLRQCECSGGQTHYDLDPDTVLDAVREAMQQVVDATDAEEAHNAAWAVDALVTVLANHGITVHWPKLWREVCPPLQRTIAADRLAAYKAWNARWQVIAEDVVTGEVTVRLDQAHRFRRALQLGAEQAARDEPRPLEPPPGWEPRSDTEAAE